jgi:erythromycin esterase-like protein
MSDEAPGLVRNAALWFEPEADGLAALVEQVGDARLVLVGEATRGSEDFSRLRAELTRALIVHKGFNIVAAEADWPDACRVNRFVRHAGSDPTAAAALSDFTRFPRWMWRNTEVVRFLEWLRTHNASRAPEDRAGFYGLDLYSLQASVAAVLKYLGAVDPAAAARARTRYACFEGLGEDAESYSYAATLGLTRSCEDETVARLTELRRKAGEHALRDGSVAADREFLAEQNARLSKDAESYYRAMFGARQRSWNQRATHMMETLDALLAHLGRTSGGARAVVWAHNSHVGDARATEMGQHGASNLGQLARERYGSEVRLIGLTTYAGTVTAAADWDEPTRQMRVRPALPASYEALFHTVGMNRFLLAFEDEAVCEALTTPRLQRTIGSIYRPETERLSHYFTAQLCKQFDVVLHVDRTQALPPLETWVHVEGDLPETYPSGV